MNVVQRSSCFLFVRDSNTHHTFQKSSTLYINLITRTGTVFKKVFHEQTKKVFRGRACQVNIFSRDGRLSLSEFAFRFSTGIEPRVFQADQRGTPDHAVRHPAPAAGLVQRAGLGRPAEVVVHGPEVTETEHVQGTGARARARHPGLGPGRDPERRVRRAGPRRQPERAEQQDRLGAEPDRGAR